MEILRGLALTLLLSVFGQAALAQDKPNIVLVFMDSRRRDAADRLTG
jgi:hypothetical protein